MSMKFRCERDTLVEALSAAGRAVTTRGGALPVLAGVRMELVGDRLTVTGSDLDLTITVEVEVAGVEDGVAVLPSKLISDVARSLRPGAVDIAIEDEDARIVSAPSEFSIRVIPADEFPELSSADGDAVTLDASAFRAAIDQVEKAASSDDARPILTGVLMAAEEDGLRLVSTDSYRLSVRDLAGTTILGEGQKVLVPSQDASAAQPANDVTYLDRATRLTRGGDGALFVFRREESATPLLSPAERDALYREAGAGVKTGTGRAEDAAPEELRLLLKDNLK